MAAFIYHYHHLGSRTLMAQVIERRSLPFRSHVGAGEWDGSAGLLQEKKTSSDPQNS